MVKSKVDVDTCDMLNPVVETRLPNGRIRVDHMNYEKSLTQQCFAEASDINVIMKRWLSGGPPPVSDASKAVFKDVSHGMDYQSMMNTVVDVQQRFDELPAELRAKFKNNPSMLLDFVHDPANEEEAIQLGLIFDEPGTTLSVPTPRVGDVSQTDSAQSSLDVTVRSDTASV